LREELIFRAVEDDLVCKMNEMAHMWHSCAGAPSGWEDDTQRVEFHRKEASKAFRDVGRLRLPWYKQWSQDEGRELVDAWKAFKEREKDPEYAAYIRKLRAEVNEKVDKARIEMQALEEIRKDVQRREKEKVKITSQRAATRARYPRRRQGADTR
jgi:hypothetical protein